MKCTAMRCCWMLVLIGILCFVAGYLIGQDSIQDPNLLIQTGFTITDPEGQEVRRFD